MGYIYRAYNEISQKSYIGFTTRTIEKRWKEHVTCALKEWGCDYNTVLSKAIRKYPLESWTLIELDEADNVEKLKELEIHYIDEYHTFAQEKDTNGYNSTHGGDSVGEAVFVPVVLVYIVSGEVFKVFKNIKSANDFFRCRIDNINKNGIAFTNHSDVFCFVLKSIVDSKTQEELKEFIYSNCPYIVHMLDYEGKLLFTFPDAGQANMYTNISIGNIINCCLGKRRMAGGFQWCYQKDIDKRLNVPLKGLSLGKPIVQYGMDGKKIKEWPNTETAAKFYGINGSHITGCCTGSRLSCKNFQWRYKSDNIQELGPLTTRKVICEQTGEMFDTRSHAARHFNLSMDVITKSVNGGKVTGPYTFKYV